MYMQIETKSRITVVSADRSLLHNIPELIGSNLLITRQGVDGDGTVGRVVALVVP
jgi:hypothetical protein